MNHKSALDLTQYSQVSFIGNGGFGEVYKVQDEKSGDIVAAKISLTFIDESSEQSYRDLRREINILSRINHPSTVRFIGFSPTNFHGEKKPVIITEYLSNGSLEDILELEKKGLCKNAWNDTRKLICIYGIASGMSYLHKHEIIHRDLKPGNILMDDFLCPRIADFGLSKIKNQSKESISANSTAMIKGTAIYIAPEIWEEMDYTPACDVYAFAIIVYQIISGEEPWKNLKFLQIHTKVEAGVRPDIYSSVPEAYKNLIEKCWDQNPEKRPTFDQILEELQNEEGFITELVEKEDFLDYIDFLENSKISFDKNPIQIDQYIKRKSTTFNKVSLKKETNDNQIIIESEDHKSSSTNSHKTSTSEQNKPRRHSFFKKSKNKILYPIHELNKLDAKNRQIVEEASEDPDKEFQIAQYLFEGKEGFPQSTEIGLLYIEHSAKSGSLEATIYYTKLLIKGDIIPRDIDKASKLMKKYKKTNNGTILFLQGKIKKKKNEQAKAFKYFDKSAKLGNAEGMYEMGKMLLVGLGCTKNEKEAKRYFEMAKKNGISKSDKFLSSNKSTNETKNDTEGKNKKEILQYYKKEADKGKVEAMYQYGQMLYLGDGVQQDKKEAMIYFKKASDKEHPESMLRYGLILDNGEVDEIDSQEASIYFKKLAIKGNLDGMALYARYIRTYGGSESERKLAVKYAKTAAEKGNVEGMYQYARMLVYGFNVIINKKEGIRYLEKAADNEHVYAMIIYANMIKDGEIPSINEEQATRYYKKIIPIIKKEIDNGDAGAMNIYGVMLEYGNGVEVNLKEACRYYKMSADKGDSDGMKFYGVMLEYGKGVEANLKEAARYYKMSADNGDSDGMRNYGVMLEYGKGVKVNLKEAARYYKMSAEKGNADAMRFYGLALENGKGIDVNLKEACRYYKMSADKGSDTGMLYYGIMLENGKGVPVDKKEAVRYYKMSSDAGNALGTGKLGYMTYLGEGIKQDKKEGVRLIKLSADNGCPEAIEAYASLLEEGTDVPKNIKEANRYRKMLKK